MVILYACNGDNPDNELPIQVASNTDNELDVQNELEAKDEGDSEPEVQNEPEVRDKGCSFTSLDM